MPPRTIACWVCGTRFTTTKPNARYCSDPCRPSNTPKGSSAQRGYDNKHRTERARLLPTAWGTPCAACGHTMVKGQRLHFDHVQPLSRGGQRASRFLHAACNQSRGNGTNHTPLLDAIRRTPTTPRKRTRDW